nr:MAG TPA: Lipopolysaccharide assembly protein A domain [Caudoviricetes sp.]
MKFLHTLLVYLMLGSFIIAILLGIIEAYAVHRELRSVSQKTEKAILITLGCMTFWSLILSYI